MADRKELPACASREFIGVGNAVITHTIRDAVCGRTVPKERAVVKVAPDGRRCYFCSRRCLVRYYLNPFNFLAKR